VTIDGDDDTRYYCPHGEEVATPGDDCDRYPQEDAYDGDYDDG